MATCSAKKQIRKDQKWLNRRGITAESPAYAEILTLIQKFLNHFKTKDLPKIGHLKIGKKKRNQTNSQLQISSSGNLMNFLTEYFRK